MKISKLFHWLYALIMFLPVFFWIPTAFYYGFNEHATNPRTTDVQINYKYQSNEINSVEDLVVGNIYHFNINNDTLDAYFTFDSSMFLEFNILYCYTYDFDNYSLDLDDYIPSNSIEGYTTIYFYSDNSVTRFDTYFGSDEYIYSLTTDNLGEYPFTLNCVIELLNYNQLIDSQIFTYTDFNVIESVDVIENGGISNAMSKSWQDVWSLPMFSWTHDTFFSAPFNYIAGLFGIQAGNTLSYCLSYWFSISIIWLVFDLMIYVPLLVHRWLDKAGIQ